MEKLDTTPRKLPKQSRARQTVDAIVTASARILIDEGYDELSTNRIAKRAGVSPGTLYQYFPNKEAILATLIDSIVEESQRVLARHLASVLDEPLSSAAQKMVQALVEMAQTVDPELVSSLIEQVPRLGKLEAIGDIRKKGTDLARTYLKMHQGELRVKNLDAAVFFVVAVAETLTYRIVFDRPARLSLKVCVDETTDLLLRYLID